MQKSLAQIKATSGRDITSQVDNNTLVYGETGSGTGGAFNFMTPINNALANQTSLKNKGDASSDANLAFPTEDKTEFYNVSYNATNVPLNTCSWVIKVTKRGNGIHQIAYSSEDTAKNYVYSRVGTYDGGNPTWGDWEQIVTLNDLNSFVRTKKMSGATSVFDYSDLTNQFGLGIIRISGWSESSGGFLVIGRKSGTGIATSVIYGGGDIATITTTQITFLDVLPKYFSVEVLFSA